MRATPREWRSCNDWRVARIIRDVTNNKNYQKPWEKYEKPWKDMSKKDSKMIGTACKNCSEKRTDWSLSYWKVQLFQKQKRTNMLIKVGSLQDLATPAIPPYPSAERKTFCHLFSNRFLGGFQSTIISFIWALDLNYCGTNWKNMEKGPRAPTLSIFNNISQSVSAPPPGECDQPLGSCWLDVPGKQSRRSFINVETPETTGQSIQFSKQPPFLEWRYLTKLGIHKNKIIGL